jgi:hypothetical protein
MLTQKYIYRVLDLLEYGGPLQLWIWARLQNTKSKLLQTHPVSTKKKHIDDDMKLVNKTFQYLDEMNYLLIGTRDARHILNTLTHKFKLNPSNDTSENVDSSVPKIQEVEESNTDLAHDQFPPENHQILNVR